MQSTLTLSALALAVVATAAPPRRNRVAGSTRGATGLA